MNYIEMINNEAIIKTQYGVIIISPYHKSEGYSQRSLKPICNLNKSGIKRTTLTGNTQLFSSDFTCLIIGNE